MPVILQEESKELLDSKKQPSLKKSGKVKWVKRGNKGQKEKGEQLARQVALKVIEERKNGKIPKITKIAESVGYSRNTALANTGKIKRNRGYVKVMNNFLGSLKEKRAMALDSVSQEKLEKASVRDLAYTTDVFSKNINLIEGKPTSIEAGIGALLIRLDDQANQQRDKNKGT